MATPPAIAEVCERALRLPCAPVLLPRLIAVIRDQQSTAQELERLILQDSALAAGTLRMVNSAAYAPQERVSDLRQAIVLVGYREIYRLASLTALARWEEAHQDALPWDPGAFARNSFARAVAAELIAEQNGLDPVAAYTAGLVAEIGMLALAYLCAPYYPLIAEAAREMPWEYAERVILEYDNRDVGMRLLRAWHFPLSFITMNEFRSSPEDAPVTEHPFLAALHAADWIALCIAPMRPSDASFFERHTPFLAAHGLNASVLEQAKAVVIERVARRLNQ